MTPNKLTQPFSEELFSEITEQLIGHDFTKDNRNISISGKNLKHIKEVKNLGHYSGLNLQVFIVKNTSENDARIGLSKELFGIMKEYSFSNALIATYNNSGNWRYSLLTSNLSIANDGHVVQSFSSPKRYSYLLGKGAKVATPYKYLIKNGEISDFDDLQKRFSVEVVNNDFYKEIAKLYDDLVGTSTIKGAIEYPSDGDGRHQFAVRLIGRIVFCWFLREKHSSNDKPLVNNEILSSSTADKTNDYYLNILTPLFFEVLNKPILKRAKSYSMGAFGDIPYLNGGLFSPQLDDHYKFDSITEKSIPGLANVPDKWIRNFFDLLETYHFTVDENTSVDIDLSIDPEMLGRIFENLLARINPETGETVRKSTGSFYTPRAIVEYMVDETISQYLINKTGIDAQKIKSLVSYDLDDDAIYPLEETEKQMVIKALGKVKILDPACGSGAFPIGVLQKIVFILQQIDPEAKLWFENQINTVPPESRRLIEEEFMNKNFDYIRKLGVIRESIFGVDIQPIATEIARLRCFLTLIVDERIVDDEPNRGVYPLPNLDFKFVTANTLIQLNPSSNNEIQLFEDTEGLDELSNIMADYFNSPSNERDGIKYSFSQTQKKIFGRLFDSFSDVSHDTSSYKLSSWDPFELKPSKWFDPEWMYGIRDGFDIIIGNPPYVQLKKGVYSKNTYPYSEGLDKGKQNLYKVFIEFSYNNVCDDGIVCLITQSSLMCDVSAAYTRKMLLNNTRILQTLEFPKRAKDSSNQVFETVLQGTCIILFEKKTPGDDYNFNLSINNDTKTISSPLFESVSQGELKSYYPGTFYIPMLNSGEFEVVKKIERHSTHLSDYVKNITKGDLNLGTNKDCFGSERTNVRLLRGRNVGKFKLNSSTDEFIIEGYKDELALYNASEDIIVGQNVTGTTDKYRLIFSLADNEPALWGDSVNKIVLHEGTNSKIILGILNSRLLDWYFRKTSTNNHVNGYEVDSLPIMDMINVDPDLIRDIEKSVDELIIDFNAVSEGKLNDQIYRLYNLSRNEVSTIEMAIL